jgi:phytoene dehydrogenase-like protein
MLDYIVIGAGISGLYTSYKYLLDTNYRIFDKNSFIGGRALTEDFNGTRINMGAGVIGFDNDHLLKLLNELKIETIDVDSPFHYPQMEFYKSNKPNGNDLIPLFKKMLELFQNEYNKLENKHMKVKDFLYLHFDSNYVQKFIDNSSFMDYLEADLQKTVKDYPFADLLDIVPQKFKFIKGSWKVLVDKLVNKIGNDRIHTECELIEVTKKDNYYKSIIKTNNKTFEVSSKKIIFCADISIKNIKFNGFDMNILNHISSMPFMRVYTYHNIMNLDYAIKTNSILDKIIPINNNVLMSAYCDNWKTRELLPLISSSDKLKNIDKLLKNSLKSDYNKVSDAVDIKYKYWEHGIHYYNVNPNLDQSELNKIGIYIAGEMISNHQGWVEGAIKSVDKLKL